jgi:alpha-tubulin suppressor-like RCC1 family protein
MSSELLLLGTASNTTTYTWGYGQVGRLDDSNNFGPFVKSPSVVTDKNFSTIVCNGSTFLGISGTDLWAWGSASHGVLGQGVVANNASSPVQIAGSWIDVAIGATHVLAIKTGGTLWAWGRNDYGQLGLNDRASRSSPVQVGANTWLDVSAGDSFSVALRSDNTVWAFGLDNRFQLGQGLSSTGNHRSSPVQVAGGGTYTNVFAGQQTAYAIQTGGTLWGWGANNSSGTPTSYYYLLATGVPTTTNAQSAPVQISSATGWSKVSNTNATSVAAIKNNELWVWGTNEYGQLGTGNLTTYSSPVQVTGSWLDVHISYSTIAVKSSNELFSWGYVGDFYGLGVNLYPGPTSPVLVNNSLLWSKVTGPLNTATSFGQKNTAFAITTSAIGSNLYGWGSIQPSVGGLLYGYSTEFISSPVQVGNQLNKFSKIVASNSATTFPNSVSEVLDCNTMGVTKSKQVFGWGSNIYGSLGDNSTIPRSSPVLISAQSHTDVALGNGFSVFLREDGTLWSCGTALRVGNGGVNASSPVQLGSNTNWTFVGAAYSCGYAVNNIGYLYGWGEASYGELANSFGSFYASSPILIGTDYSKVYGAANSVFAIKTNGTLWSSGSNRVYGGTPGGLLGRGASVTLQANTLQQITGTFPFPWAKVAASSNHVLALDSAGNLYGWGGNVYGELGLGNITSPFDTAQYIYTDSPVTDIDVSNYTSYFVMNNRLYQMGWLKTNPISTIYASSPVLVSSVTGWQSIAVFDDGGAAIGVASP